MVLKRGYSAIILTYYNLGRRVICKTASAVWCNIITLFWQARKRKPTCADYPLYTIGTVPSP